MEIASIKAATSGFELTWVDGLISMLPYIWLRDNDASELHPDTQERTFDLTSIALDIKPLKFSHSASVLTINWPNREQCSIYTAQWLRDHRLDRLRSDAAAVRRKLWSGNDLASIPRLSATRCQHDAENLLAMLKELKSTGIVIVDSLEDDREAGSKFGNLIGFKRESNFGVIFEVINKPDPNNLAYTSAALPLHTDLPNQESVPGFQFLHCIANSATGGESLFADGFKICQDFQRDFPDYYQLLSDTPVPWRFHDCECDLIHRRTIITVDASGRLRNFVFNAHLADVLDMPVKEVEEYYAAYQQLMLYVRNSRYVISYLLQPGEMVIFDNRRVLHGRREFDPQSGHRHLRGYYIEHNEIDSCIRVLHRRRELTPC